MNAVARRIYLGAYALTATLTQFTRRDAERFYQRLAEFEILEGLELPIHDEMKGDDPWLHLDLLPKHFNFIITPLPALMQMQKKSPRFGLASDDAEARQAALKLLDQHRQRIARLNDQVGRSAVTSILIHSGPSRLSPAGPSSLAALRASIDTLWEWDFGGAELCLEHCDAYRNDQAAAKGFLPLEMEIEALRGSGIGLSLNWGRSCLEGRSIKRVEEHIATSQKAGLLRAFFFSGVAAQDPIYGSWQDNHAPIFTESKSSWQATGSLLRAEILQKTILAIDDQFLRLGLKIQPAPEQLDLEHRMSFLREQLKLFKEALPSCSAANELS